MIKGVLLDYGGTIDTNGVHWGEVLWNVYLQYKVPVSKEVFREAYSYGEKALAVHPFIKPEHNFLDLLQIKLQQQFSFIYDNGHLQDKDLYSKLIPQMAHDCNSFAAACIADAKPVLARLAARYPLVLVSNFYGNITSVLSGFGILHYFTKIIESSIVGFRKPDPQLFNLGVQALGFPATDCVVIGDSYLKDIAPGKQAGCFTIWLKGEGWEKDPAEPVLADRIIKNFSQLPDILTHFNL
jgi:putative hydrolase of the HAD superfamily